MKTPRQALGRQGEDLAIQYLEAQGYQVIIRNFRAGRGEIDLIAWAPNPSVIPAQSVIPAKAGIYPRRAVPEIRYSIFESSPF